MTTKSSRITPGTKLRDAEKMAHIPIKVVTSERETMLRKPNWLRIKLPNMICILFVKKPHAQIYLNALTTAQQPL